MPVDWKRYPANWKEISLACKDRSGWKCEWCGAPHGEVVVRCKGGFWSTEPDMGDEHGTWFNSKGDCCHTETVCDALDCDMEAGSEGQMLPVTRLWRSKVVLTCAHLGTPHVDGSPGDKHDKHDVRPENLAALCQSCHLSYDHADHIAHGKQTRFNRRAAGVLELF